MTIATLGHILIRCKTTPYCAGMQYEASAASTRALCCTAGTTRPRHVREALDPGPAALCRQDRLQNLCATVQVATGMTHSMALCAVPATGHESDDGWGDLDLVSTPDPQGPKLADARRSWVTRAVRVAQGGVPAGATRKMGMGSASDLRGVGPRVGSGHPPPAGRRPRPWHLRHLQRVVTFGRAGLCSRPSAGGARAGRD